MWTYKGLGMRWSWDDLLVGVIKSWRHGCHNCCYRTGQGTQIEAEKLTRSPALYSQCTQQRQGLETQDYGSQTGRRDCIWKITSNYKIGRIYKMSQVWRRKGWGEEWSKDLNWAWEGRQKNKSGVGRKKGAITLWIQSSCGIATLVCSLIYWIRGLKLMKVRVETEDGTPKVYM